jgi:ferredoxin-NADP reductase
VVSVSAVADDTLAFTLADPAGAPLPPWTPGAHLDLVLPSGLERQYSLSGDPGDRYRYQVTVLREAGGRGGSAELHERQLCGQTVTIHGPRNHFALEQAPAYAFIAGGIGITPLLPMIRAVAGRAPWNLLYGARTRSRMAYADELLALGPDLVRLCPQDECGQPDLAEALSEAGSRDALVYACGPAAMLDAVLRTAAGLGLPQPRIERFAASGQVAAGPQPGDADLEVELARTGRVLLVPPDQPILAAVRAVLPDVPYSCEEGFCGACETTVLSGEPEHRDEVLSAAERATGKTMMICVSRARGRHLTLDL